MKKREEKRINFWTDIELREEFEKYLKVSNYDGKSSFFRTQMRILIKEEKEKEKKEKFFKEI